jgi:hypothetical protein
LTEIKGEERAIANIARKYYTDGTFALNQSEAGWVDLFTDSVFLSPDQKTAQLTALRVPNVYNYVLDFTDRFSVARLLGAKDNTWAPVHGDDLGEETAQSRIGTPPTPHPQASVAPPPVRGEGHTR